MIHLATRWWRHYFSDPQAVVLAVFLIVGTLVLWLVGKLLLPLLIALILAYLLEAPVQRMPMRRLPSVCLVFFLFLLFLVLVVLVLIPVLSLEFSNFFQDMPKMISNGQELLLRLPEQYPNLFSEETMREFSSAIRQEVTSLGQSMLALSVATIPVIVTVLVYLVLVPLLIFFLLADKQRVLQWCGRFLPARRDLLKRVWKETDAQIGNYIRGKFCEILIVGVVAYVVFALFGLNYAPLLAILVGLSVLVPYIGAAVVTLPIAFVAYAQWGFTNDFFWLLCSYAGLQFLDGNVLVPLLFSEVVNLHPIAIIVAILLFGGMWGFWGVFFAIPLATLLKVIMGAWPVPAGQIRPQVPPPESELSEPSTDTIQL